MLIALGIIAAVSGTLTYFLLKKKEHPYIHPNYSERPFDYKGVRPFDPIKKRVMFYPYNYVNG
jgi:hypothetical protein